MEPLILTLDRAGLPSDWVEIEEAITYHARGVVVYSLGDFVCEYRGGIQRDGRRSRIETRSILAIRGLHAKAHEPARAPVVANRLLFARDRHLCAYCGLRFLTRDLSCDHVVPASKGGKHHWMNVVTACRTCNTRKADRTPEQARMALRYVPYVPNRYEHFILRNRNILADQMEYLLAGVPRGSRLHA